MDDWSWLPQGYTGEDDPRHAAFTNRALWHDYHSPRTYMLTLLKMEGIPDFSRIEGRMISDFEAVAEARLTPLGASLREAWRWSLRKYPEVRMLRYVFMPDHLHVLLRVTQRIAYHPGDVVRSFRLEANERYRDLLLRKYELEFDGRIFQTGYNDRILTKKGQLDTTTRYIIDNPRRLYLKREHPEFFVNVMGGWIGGQAVALYGNLLLLEGAMKCVVRYSRGYSEDERRLNRARWEETLRAGGVLVSPFIHPEERAMMQRALEAGGRVIWIRPDGFPDRWKPSGRYFDYCAAGQLLLIGQIGRAHV